MHVVNCGVEVAVIGQEADCRLHCMRLEAPWCQHLRDLHQPTQSGLSVHLIPTRGRHS